MQSIFILIDWNSDIVTAVSGSFYFIKSKTIGGTNKWIGTYYFS